MSYQLGSIDPDDEAAVHFAGSGEMPRRRRGMLVSVLAAAVMAAFAGGLWFAYMAGVRHSPDGGEVPLIRADNRPTRVKPDQPGGMEIPDRDMLIYRQNHPVVERLLPPPETPMPRPAPLPAPPPAAATPAAPAPAAAPPSPAPQPAVAAAPEAAPEPAPPQAAPATVAKPGAAAVGVRLQLGALKSQDLAEREWQKIRHANADLVGKLSATVVRADLGDKGVLYRIQTAPITDEISGILLCDALKQRKIGCLIAR